MVSEVKDQGDLRYLVVLRSRSATFPAYPNYWNLAVLTREAESRIQLEGAARLAAVGPQPVAPEDRGPERAPGPEPEPRPAGRLVRNLGLASSGARASVRLLTDSADRP